MKIGLITDSLQDIPFLEALEWIASIGIESVEISAGGFSRALHCDLDQLNTDDRARAQFQAAIASRGLALSALNCNGNPVDPHPARGLKHQQDLYHTIELASKLGLDTVVAMSGCPGDPTGSPYPNWVTHPWQQEFQELHQWQWNEVLTPFWKRTADFAASHRVKIAIEMHPGQAVYNTAGLQRLREIAGPVIGANLDPSHLFHQGMDPIHVIHALGPNFVFHVHAKDMVLNSYLAARDGVFDLRPMHDISKRTWAYRTLGFGHDELWWRNFISALRIVGYDGVLSIEHEDGLMSVREGIQKSVEFLRPLLVRSTPEAKPTWL